MSSARPLSDLQKGYVRKAINDLKATALDSEDWPKRFFALGAILYHLDLAEPIRALCSWPEAKGWSQLQFTWQYVRHLLVAAVGNAESEVLLRGIRGAMQTGKPVSEPDRDRAAKLAVLAGAEMSGFWPNLKHLDEETRQRFMMELEQTVEALLTGNLAGIPGSCVAPPPNEIAAANSPALTYTLRDLIHEVDGSEAAFAANTHTADRVEAEDGSISANWWRAQASALRFRPDPERISGIDRIVLLCDELDGEVGISSAKLRRLRAKVCRIKSISLVKAGELSLEEAASILESGETPGPNNGTQLGYFDLQHEINSAKDFISTVIEKELPRLDALAQEGDAAKFIELVLSFIDTIWFSLSRIHNELKSDPAISAPPNKPAVQSRRGAELAMANALAWLDRAGVAGRSVPTGGVPNNTNVVGNPVLPQVIEPPKVMGEGMAPVLPFKEDERPLTPEERARVFQEMVPCERKAYLVFHFAETKKGERLEDREAYDYVNENGVDQDKGDVGELTNYELPEFDTWARQLRKARKALQEQKYKKRGAPRATRSIVKGNQIEDQNSANRS
jgi:hypothetical protein